MIKLIQNLRRKPKAVRDNVALGVAGTVTTFVAFGWLVLGGIPFGSLDGTVAERESGTGAFSTIVSGVREQTAALGDVFNSLQEQTEEVQTEMDAIIELGLPTVASGALSTTSTTTEETVRSIRIATTTDTTNATTTEGI